MRSSSSSLKQSQLVRKLQGKNNIGSVIKLNFASFISSNTPNLDIWKSLKGNDSNWRNSFLLFLPLSSVLGLENELSSFVPYSCLFLWKRCVDLVSTCPPGVPDPRKEHESSGELYKCEDVISIFCWGDVELLFHLGPFEQYVKVPSCLLLVEKHRSSWENKNKWTGACFFPGVVSTRLLWRWGHFCGLWTREVPLPRWPDAGWKWWDCSPLSLYPWF